MLSPLGLQTFQFSIVGVPKHLPWVLKEENSEEFILDWFKFDDLPVVAILARSNFGTSKITIWMLPLFLRPIILGVAENRHGFAAGAKTDTTKNVNQLSGLTSESLVPVELNLNTGEVFLFDNLGKKLWVPHEFSNQSLVPKNCPNTTGRPLGTITERRGHFLVQFSGNGVERIPGQIVINNFCHNLGVVVVMIFVFLLIEREIFRDVVVSDDFAGENLVPFGLLGLRNHFRLPTGFLVCPDTLPHD